MCGLIGSFNYSGRALPLSLEAIRHRGPDGAGSWLSPDKSCWLGHTRLAIQDLSDAGAQPITSHCGRLVLVFNGEIYNHLESRSLLSISGWRGHSDSETLVEGLAQQGPAFLSQLSGMFAFAAYDLQANELFLGRDRLGIKPLFLVAQDDCFFFSSEQQSLPVKYELTPKIVSEVLSFGHPSTPSIISVTPSGLSRPVSLPAGIVIRVDQSGRQQTFRFWGLQDHSASKSFSSPLPLVNSLREATSLLRSTIDQVVSQHLLGDVPVACFLSSGLDSGILAALACRHNLGGISTFTVALPGTPQDEGTMARQMALHCGSNHHELIIDYDQATLWVETALASLDSPSADAINTFIISKAVAQNGFKVALSGLGADELFGGYPSHRITPLLRSLNFVPSPFRHALLRLLTPRFARKLQGVTQWDDWHLSLALRRWASNSDLLAAGATAFQWPDSPPHIKLDTWGICSWAELFGYTEPMLLRDTDAMSMSCGLEIRVPFLDHRIVEFALLTAQRFQRPGKFLLRAACSDLFPPGYLNRPKQGFALPMRDWMLGPLLPLCQNRLQCLRDSGFLNSGWLDNQWASFVAGHLNWPRAWSLVVLGEFAHREPKPGCVHFAQVRPSC
jgi:asparagine synthase (glutamine-hydrolysing)